MKELKGTYHEGVTQKACKMVVHADKLYLYLDDPEKTMYIWDIARVATERRGSGLILKKGEAQFECSAETAREIERKLEEIPLQPSKRPVSMRPIHVFFISLVVLIIGAVLFCYFILFPWIAEKAINIVPMEMEVSLGDKISDNITAGAITNDSVSHYAQKFVDELELDTRYPVKVSIIHSKEINAFALPGGRIFIYTGLLEKMDSYEELVALLGHELTHVTQRHALKSIFWKGAGMVVISSVFGDAGAGSWLLSKADEFRQLHYSRELETEADNFGLKVMVKNKVDPSGMVHLLELLDEETGQMPTLMKYVSTHPETEARILNVRSQLPKLKKFPQNEPLQRSFDRLKKSLSRFK